MYKGVIRWHATCPKHTRFNPDRQGLGAIKGGCPDCQKLVDIQRAVRSIRSLSKELEDSRRDAVQRPEAAA